MTKKDINPSEKAFESALKVNKGVERLPDVNEKAIKSLLARRRSDMSVAAYVEGIVGGDRGVLSKAITLIESALPEHYQKAQQIIEACMPHSGNSFRLGITGVPGAGKSTFIEAFGMQLIGRGHKIAVLAVDPSSEISGGSILGDKTRMEQLSVHENAFIRPSPSAGTLGGVARKTREIIVLCEAAGFNRILVETVGVGQSETAVHSMVDYFLLIMLAGAGDELQGIKRGIMEMCDGMIINKADGDNITAAQIARNQYQNALHLFPPAASGRTPEVKICSSIKKTGLQEIEDMLNEYEDFVRNSGYFSLKRKGQLNRQMNDAINSFLLDHFKNDAGVHSQSNEVMQKLKEESITPYKAAQLLLDAYFTNLKGEK